MGVRRFLVTGCSGGGKSTLATALSACGVHIMPEAGRQIVQEQIASGGLILPWLNMPSFIEKLWHTALSQFGSANNMSGLVLFDRGFIEALAYWKMHDRGKSVARKQVVGDRKYCDPVFVTPPWRELFLCDAERRHDFSSAVFEYDAICDTLNDLGYRQIEVLKIPIGQRIEFVKTYLDIGQQFVQ